MSQKQKRWMSFQGSKKIWPYMSAGAESLCSALQYNNGVNLQDLVCVVLNA